MRPVLKPVRKESRRPWRGLGQILAWVVGAIFAFVVPVGLVLAAILVSSYGIPLPIEVRVP
jgi:hypothetical protein